MAGTKTYRIALGVSLLLHLLLLLLYVPLARLMVPATPLQAAEEPLAFEFEEEKPHELVETPESARVDKPQDARFLSDKNALAQNLKKTEVSDGLPYSEGRAEEKIFAGAAPVPAMTPQGAEAVRSEPAEARRPSEEKPPEEGTPLYQRQVFVQPGKRFSRDLLQQQSAPPAVPFTDSESWNNRRSSVDALGGVSLSTYEWDYAPYIFYMKQRIREHLYPPQAFVQLGAISGRVMLRFVLHRDGTVHNLEFLGSEGHKSFIEPSMNSIRASDPFKPLPADFPDPELELTWTFIYTVF